MNQKPTLKVFLNDHPELPSKAVMNDFESKSEVVNFDYEELIVPDGKAVSFYFSAEDLTLRLTTYFVNDAITIYSVPAEPVVAFRIQIANGHYAKFADGRDRSLWMEDQTYLFWQNEEVVAYELEEGVYTHFDLFFRPVQFLEMADRHPILREMAMDVKTSETGKLDFFIAMHNDRTHALYGAIMEELDHYDVTNSRLLHLSECILLRSMGIDIPVDPLPEDCVKKMSDPWSQHDFDDADRRHGELFTEKQLYFIADLQSFTKDELIRKFKGVKFEYLENKKRTVAQRALLGKIKNCYNEIVGESAEMLSVVYFRLAESLDEQSDKFNLSDEELEKITAAIKIVCDQSFELSSPDADSLDLYVKWTKTPYYVDIGVDEACELFAHHIPDIDLTNLDGSKEGKAIFFEHMKDSFDLKSRSFFTGETEKDKPQEVVKLYHMLMENMSDEITITEDGKIKKSDRIRIMDHAYERNDLIPLLLMEVEHFTSNPMEVNNQSFEKLCHWILAIDEGIEQLKVKDALLEKDPLYYLMDIYENAPEKMKAVANKAYARKNLNARLTPVLLMVKLKSEQLESKSFFLKLVESLILTGETPLK